MPGLPDTERSALAWLDGTLTPRGNTMAGALAAVAFACMRHGIDEPGYENLVEYSALGRSLAERPVFKSRPAKLAALVAGQWDWATGHFQPGDGSADQIREKARALMARVMAASWPADRDGVTLRRIALALVAVAVKRGAYTFDCSVRFLASESGVPDIKTVGKARKALADRGLIQLDGEGNRLRRVTLNLGWCSSPTNKPLAEYLFVGIAHRLMPHDLFTKAKGALGPVAGWVWAASPETGDMSHAEIAALLGVNKSTVTRAARALESAGVGPEADLDAIAAARRVLGYRDRLAELFAVEQAENRQERLDWYSAKVQAAAEDDRRLRANQDTISVEQIRQIRELVERVRRLDPRTIPDPFAERRQIPTPDDDMWSRPPDLTVSEFGHEVPDRELEDHEIDWPAPI